MDKRDYKLPRDFYKGLSWDSSSILGDKFSNNTISKKYWFLNSAMKNLNEHDRFYANGAFFPGTLGYERLKNIVGSFGFDSNAGFLRSIKAFRQPNKYPGALSELWVPYPNETKDKLRKLTKLKASFWERVKFLFRP